MKKATLLTLLIGCTLGAYAQIPQINTVSGKILRKNSKVIENAVINISDTAQKTPVQLVEILKAQIDDNDDILQIKKKSLKKIIDEAAKDPKVTGLASLKTKIEKLEEVEKIQNLSSELPYLALSGIGNISSQTEQVKVDPSANIQFSMSLSQKKRWRAYGGYNIGGSIDTTSADSLSMPAIFFPDKSKNGFYMGASLDLLRMTCGHHIPTIEHVMKLSTDETNKQYFFVGELYAEYYYLKKQIKDTGFAVPRIQTSTFIVGTRAGGVLNTSGNSFGLFLNPYFKSVSVTDATVNTYNDVFRNKNYGFDLPQNVWFFGANINLQINKIILGFTYEELLTDRIKNPDVWGGVFVLKASVAADFFNFY
jgi:hypothetical protein